LGKKKDRPPSLPTFFTTLVPRAKSRHTNQKHKHAETFYSWRRYECIYIHERVLFSPFVVVFSTKREKKITKSAIERDDVVVSDGLFFRDERERGRGRATEHERVVIAIFRFAESGFGRGFRGGVGDDVGAR